MSFGPCRLVVRTRGFQSRNESSILFRVIPAVVAQPEEQRSFKPQGEGSIPSDGTRQKRIEQYPCDGYLVEVAHLVERLFEAQKVRGSIPRLNTIGRSSNGKTPDFESVDEGSIPSLPACRSKTSATGFVCGRSSTGKASDCGSGGCGFDSRRSLLKNGELRIVSGCRRSQLMVYRSSFFFACHRSPTGRGSCVRSSGLQVRILPMVLRAG